MKKLLVLGMVLVSFVSYGQNFVSRKQHITNIRGEYIMNQVNGYFTIKGDTIVNTDRKMKEIYDTFIVDKVVQKGDSKTKWDIIKSDKGEITSIRIRGIDTFTEKSFLIIYELVVRE